MAFKEDVQKYIEIGVNASKEAFEKAGKAVNKFGNDSVLRIEKMKIQGQLKKEITELGLDVLKSFIDDGKDSIASSEPDIARHIEKIKMLKEEIAKREDSLRKE